MILIFFYSSSHRDKKRKQKWKVGRNSSTYLIYKKIRQIYRVHAYYIANNCESIMMLLEKMHNTSIGSFLFLSLLLFSTVSIIIPSWPTRIKLHVELPFLACLFVILSLLLSTQRVPLKSHISFVRYFLYTDRYNFFWYNELYFFCIFLFILVYCPNIS